MNKVSPDYLPAEEGHVFPLSKEAVLKLEKFEESYHAALAAGDPNARYKAIEQMKDFFTETEILTPDRFNSLDPVTREIVIEAYELTNDYADKDTTSNVN